jgi:cytochrome c peroxidase
MLRNILKTAPYLHDGSVATIEEMVRLMVRHQLGKSVTDAEIADLIAFFSTLTGDLPLDHIQIPALPPSSAKTLQPLPISAP